MSIDFTKLQALEIPEGVVTQIEDASGRVLWMVSGGKVILEVEKITSDTYAAETTYGNEEFILLDIYPKTNGTVSVTYGGLTKTITDTSGAEEPNAQQVYFGTFNGVSDSVTTPASGTLTIEGDYSGFGVGVFSESSKSATNYCGCVIAVNSFGDVTKIPAYAFNGCNKITSVKIPNCVTEIGDNGFNNCDSLISVKLSTALETIGNNAFAVSSIEGVEIPKSVTKIGYNAFVCFIVTDLKSAYSLKTVTMLAETPPELVITGSSVGESYYSNFGDMRAENKVLEKIIVPKGCGNTYKAADGWSTYADYIVEAS